MAELLAAAAARGVMWDYVNKVLAAFPAGAPLPDGRGSGGAPLPDGRGSGGGALLEPLSRRELEILQLIADGLSNQEIGARLFLALDTVKGHNRRIFNKLQVQRRTEAVAKAQELRLLPSSRLA